MITRFLTSIIVIITLFTHQGFSQSFSDLNEEMAAEYQKENYSEALKIGLLALEQAKIELGKNHTDYLLALKNLGSTYVELEEYANAITYLEKALEIEKSINGKFSEKYALDVNTLGLYYFYNSDFLTSQNLFAEAITIYEKLQLEESENYCTILENATLSYDLQDHYSMAFYTQETVLNWYINYGDTTLLDYGTAINKAAVYADLAENYDKAKFYYMKAIPYFNNQPKELLSLLNNLSNIFSSTDELGYKYIIDTTLLKTSSLVNGNKSQLYAIDLNRAAIGAFELGLYNEAITLYSSALEITDKDSENYFIVEGNLADAYIYGNRYMEGEEFVEKHGQNVAKKYGTNSLEYAMIMNNIASIKSKVGKFNEALQAYKTTKSIQENLLNKDHDDYLTTLSNISGVLIELNQYRQAEELLKKVEARYVINPGPNSEKYIIVLSSLGNLYTQMGHYNLAEKYYYKAVNTAYLLFPDSQLTGTVFGNASIIYLKTGRYEMAIHFLKESYRIHSSIFGANSLETSFSLGSVGAIQIELGEYNDAVINITNAITIISQTTDENNLLNVIPYMNLGLAHIKQKQYQKAEFSILKAISILEENNLTNSRDYGAALSLLGELKLYQHQYYRGLEYSLKAYDLQSKILGPIHPTVLLTQFTLAGIYSVLGEYEKAEKGFYIFNTGFKHHLNLFFPSLNESEKAQFYNTFSTRLMAFNSYAVNRYKTNPSIASEIYNNQLITKGMLLSSVQKVRKNILASGDSSLIALHSQWIEMMKKVASIEQHTNKANKIDDTDSLNIVINRIEKLLTKKSSEFVGSVSRLPLIWQNIRDSLKKGDVAIEIVRITDFSFEENSLNENNIFYISLIITPETKDYPQMVILKNGIDLEGKFLNGNQNSIKYKTKDPYSYIQFWQPIADQISNYSNVKKIYLSPDGVYNKISLNTLFNNDNNSYLLDEIDLHIVSSTRDLLRSKETNNWNSTSQKVALFGYPNYNKFLATSDTLTYNRFESLKKDTLSRFIRNGKVMALPGTKQEIEAIDKLMSIENLESEVYEANNASEENLKRLENPYILHIATHGFFKPANKDIGMRTGYEQASSNNPLEGSGLLLSGAQNTINGKLLEGENGILTAYEAKNLSLDNTELVVLSACETGLGSIKNGEGVYGLQRSFLVAGAKSVIMSLWTVDDTATQEMMTSFYANWLSGKTKREAFKFAQLEVRKKYPHPYYWGAFVMIGE